MAATSPLAIPGDALVILIGAAGSGKSTFAGRHFAPAAVVASDDLRRLRRAENPAAGNDVFDQLLAAVDRRLQHGKLAVVDATNTDWMRRSQLIAAARNRGRSSYAIVFDLPVELSLEQNRRRPAAVPSPMVRRQAAELARDIDRLDLEGFAGIVIVRSPADADRLEVVLAAGTTTESSSAR
jgi:predicted kinase